MGTYIYALEAPSKAIKADDLTAGNTKTIGVLKFWGRGEFGMSESNPYMKAHLAAVKRMEAPKKRAWDAAPAYPTLAVGSETLKELLEGKVNSVAVLAYPDKNLWIYDTPSMGAVAGTLFRTSTGKLEYESLT